MSRIGKQPVPIPEKVSVDIKDTTVSVEGPRGKVQKTFAPVVTITITEKKVVVAPIGDSRFANAMYGTARSIIAGIAAPGQGELLRPFTARYFAAIAGVWARRSSEVAQTVVIGLYPHWDIGDAGIAAADEFLSAPESEVPPALRRLVLEGQAGVKRALRARKFDAS